MAHRPTDSPPTATAPTAAPAIHGAKSAVCERSSVIEQVRRQAAAEGLTERAEDDELEIGWPDEEATER